MIVSKLGKWQFKRAGASSERHDGHPGKGRCSGMNQGIFRGSRRLLIGEKRDRIVVFPWFRAVLGGQAFSIVVGFAIGVLVGRIVG